MYGEKVVHKKLSNPQIEENLIYVTLSLQHRSLLGTYLGLDSDLLTS